MDMLETIRSQIKAKLDERNTRAGELNELLAKPETEGRSDFTEDEATKFAELRDTVKQADEELDALQTRAAEIEDLRSRNKEREVQARELNPGAESRQEIPGAARVGSEPTVYRRDGGASFFEDAFAVMRGMATPAASERFGRHMNEVRSGAHGQEFRDIGTSAFASLVVPVYLPEMYAEFLRAGRVTANLATPHTLPPDGMTLTIPRGTTGTSVAAQSGENTDVSETNYGAGDLVVPIRTYAGQQDMSRQSIERGRGTDDIIYADLAQAYAVALDVDVINGPGSAFRHLGLMNTAGVTTLTVTTAANTGPAFMRRLADAIQGVNTRRLLPADTIIMHPRRWGFLMASADSSGRPLVVPNTHGPQNVWGIGDYAKVGQVGEIMGLPVWVDPNLPTTMSNGTTGAGGTEDVVIVTRRSDLHLWEDGAAPRQFRFEETLAGQLTIKLVIAGYSAFTAGHHPEGVVVMSGGGLGTPTF